MSINDITPLLKNYRQASSLQEPMYGEILQDGFFAGILYMAAIKHQR